MSSYFARYDGLILSLMHILNIVALKLNSFCTLLQFFSAQSQGRFRPATFWKKSRVELVSPAQHKDRTMLTTFRLVNDDTNAQNTQHEDDSRSEYWHVLNCHLQAGKQGGRRVRQIVEGRITHQVNACSILLEWVII